MPAIAREIADIKLAALRKLHELMQETDDPAEARRCAAAILRAPKIEDPGEQSSPSRREGAGGWVRSTSDRPSAHPSSATSKNNADAHPVEVSSENIDSSALTEDKLKQIYRALATNNTELLEQLIEGDVQAVLQELDEAPG